MRYFTIDNNKLVKILEERTDVFAKITVINEKLQELDKERNVHALKLERLKDKTKVIIDEEKIETNPYEIITRVYLDDGQPTAEIVDQVEEYKKLLDEKNAESK